MLKKAGIVVAAAAAALLAVSPLAFAGDKGDDHHGHHAADKNINSVEGDETKGLVNVSGNNVNVPVQALNCNNAPVGVIQGSVDDVVASLTGALSVFGDAEAESETEVDNSCNSVQGNSNAGDTNNQGIDD